MRLKQAERKTCDGLAFLLCTSMRTISNSDLHCPFVVVELIEENDKVLYVEEFPLQLVPEIERKSKLAVLI